METYLLKFSGCLLVFWLLYILFLEKQSAHRFKRYYLLGALVLALVIPTWTITQYVEPITQNIETLPSPYIPIKAIDEQMAIQESFWNLEHKLWIIYGLGVLVFAIRFILNIYKMYERISKNERLTKPPFIYVLLKERRIPHSFFRYLFFNEMAYQNQEIPKEVIIHEETHAKQWHSLDILIMELVQIIFWFHPLVYILKHHIKLNHEFLADQAVISTIEDTKTYQNILLQFSSSTQNHELSSAINYSSFKKRFTVMKTQTSKTRVWLNTLMLLPIIAILFYNFAEREYVEKTLEQNNLKIKSKNLEQQNPPTKKEVEAYNAWAKKMKTKFEKMPESEKVNGYPHMINDDIFRYCKAIYDRMTPEQRKNAVLLPEAVLVTEWPMPVATSIQPVSQSNQEKATKKQLTEYNSWAKKINTAMAKAKANNDVNAYPIVRVKEVNKYKAIFDIMSETQRENAEPWPNFPPPPPPPPAPKVAKAKKNEYSIPPPPPPPMPKEAKGNLNEHHINAYNKWIKHIKSENPNPKLMTVEVYNYYRDLYSALTEQQKEMTDGMPPPPPPPSPDSKMVNKKPLIYEMEDGEIIEVVEVPEEQNYAVINGKPILGVGTKLTLHEFEKLTILHKKYNVTSFHIMFPDNKSFKIIGNQLNKKAKAKIETLKPNDIITLFRIENEGNVEIPPVLIEISL